MDFATDTTALLPANWEESSSGIHHFVQMQADECKTLVSPVDLWSPASLRATPGAEISFDHAVPPSILRREAAFAAPPSKRYLPAVVSFAATAVTIGLALVALV